MGFILPFKVFPIREDAVVADVIFPSWCWLPGPASAVAFASTGLLHLQGFAPRTDRTRQRLVSHSPGAVSFLGFF